MSTARRGTLRRGTDYASSTCKAGASLSASPRYIMLVSKETPMPTRDEAWQLVCEYTQSESLRKHMLAVETCSRVRPKIRSRRGQVGRGRPAARFRLRALAK